MNQTETTPAFNSSASSRWDTAELRSLALRALSRLYRADQGLFAFRIRRTRRGDRLEGVSRRYSAIVLIGLAGEELDQLEEVARETLCCRLLRDVTEMSNLGDVALTLWAAKALRQPWAACALDRLESLDPCAGPHPTVELAWALSALSVFRRSDMDDELMVRIARRLIQSIGAHSDLFPHYPRGAGHHWLRGHVGCFADQVYPIQALSHYYRATGDAEALDAAERCARRICALQGAAGQWWWHYDVRTGRVIEGYPVYSVHQDAMAPMALFALKAAGGDDHSENVDRGMAWLFDPPEISEPLVDCEAGLIWRKVARREPRKLTRTAQGLASRVHPSVRVPGLGRMLKPCVIDYECRPYHLGWLLHAWPKPTREAGPGMRAKP